MTKKETNFMKTKRIGDIRTECSAEISLPDYNTDVRKILHYSAKPHPISSFASAEGIECSGEVSFEVVYLDFEGVVCSATFEGDYSFKVKCDTGSYKDSLVETELAGMSLRLMSPRKIAARAMLNSCVTVISEATVCIDGDAFNSELNPQVDSVLISAEHTALTPPAEREYGLSLARFDGKTTDEVHLIYLSAKPIVERLEVSNGEAEITGRIEISALIRTDECPLYRLEKSIELSQKIQLEEGLSDGDIRPVIEIVSSSIATEGDEGGVEMTLSIITETRLICRRNVEEELVGDIYLCQCSCECSNESFVYEEYLGHFTSQKEINEKIALADIGAGKLREVNFADVSCEVKEVERDGDTVVVKGDIKVSAIASEIKNDGDVELVPLKFTVNFVENVNCDCQIDEKTTINADASIVGSSLTCDSDNAYIKVCLLVDLFVLEQREVDIVTSANAVFTDPYLVNPSRVSVYYPAEGDTLYTIAKAYHTTREKLLADNPLAANTFARGDDLSSVGRLIIT